MGKIYSLEAELRELCQDPKANGDQIYIKLKELVGRLIARNQSRIGPDVDRRSLDHEIAAEITVRLLAGTLEPIHNWSGYIATILPRLIKANALMNSPEVIDTYRLGIDPNNIIDMSHSGSLSMLRAAARRRALADIYELPKVVDKWLDDNIKNIDSHSTYYNIRISVILTFLNNKPTYFRLPKPYRNHVIFYYNRLRIYLSRLLILDTSNSDYDQIMKISEYEATEDFFNNQDG